MLVDGQVYKGVNKPPSTMRRIYPAKKETAGGVCKSDVKGRHWSCDTGCKAGPGQERQRSSVVVVTQ